MPENNCVLIDSRSQQYFWAVTFLAGKSALILVVVERERDGCLCSVSQVLLRKNQMSDSEDSPCCCAILHAILEGAGPLLGFSTRYDFWSMRPGCFLTLVSSFVEDGWECAILTGSLKGSLQGA